MRMGGSRDQFLAQFLLFKVLNKNEKFKILNRPDQEPPIIIPNYYR